MRNKGICLAFLLGLLLAVSCAKQEPEANESLILLYQTYKNGEIKECQLEGETVYTASLNQVDSPVMVYDRQGDLVAECNYAWGKVDAACEQLTSCTVIYRVEDHISGEPPVDKYGLGK